jgi:hypothetical protein
MLYVIIDYNIARIKTPDDHWYTDEVNPETHLVHRTKTIVVRRLYSGNVIINDYVVPAVICRDIPMVVQRLYSGNAIVQNKDAGRPLVYLYIVQPGLRNH